MPALDALISEHRRHYEPGTFETFQAWFARSGHLDMLNNPWLRGGAKREVQLQYDALATSQLRDVTFSNGGAGVWRIRLEPKLEADASSLERLFYNFVRSTGHTHLPGDFRLNLGHFLKVYSGSRYLLFDGSGTCLLFGAMFQSLAGRVLGEKVDLHYSHSAKRELTHVFGTWRNEYFVDPDQKTWVPLREIDQSAVFGYLFQQFGVSAHQVYRAINATEREFLFATMTRDYFAFYDNSVNQYMYHHHQDTGDVTRYFLEARQRYCSPLSVDAVDFPWKAELRRQADELGIERPYFLINCGKIPIEIPPGGSFKIGHDTDRLPSEADLLATLFLGRVPATLTVPMTEGRCRTVLPEFPWLIVFDPDVFKASINGREMITHRSRCGRYSILGMGQFETAFDISSGHDEYQFDLFALGAKTVKIILPFNAFPLASNLVHIDAPGGDGRTIAGSVAA